MAPPLGAAPAAVSAVVLAPGQVVQATSLNGAGSTPPTDGRLRGPDFAAVVNPVAWPQSVPSASGSYVAGTGRRLVAFALSVTQASADSGLGDTPTGVTASLKVGTTVLPVSMSNIDQQIAGGTSGSTPTTGTESFVASVPARGHDASLTLSEGGFSQSFDLWTLQRSPPGPVVLYRDPSSSTVSGTAAGPFHVSFTNPADGFSSSDDAQVRSATLGYFAQGDTGTTPANPAQAFLVLELQSSYPSVPYGQPNSGHFFSSFSPLPANQVTFTPNGGSAVPATGTPPTSRRSTRPATTTGSSMPSTRSECRGPRRGARSGSRPGRPVAPSTPASPARERPCRSRSLRRPPST